MRQKNFTVRPWGKFGLVLGLLGLLAGSYYVGVTNQSSSSDRQKIKVCRNYGKLPLYFIENKGQVDSRVKFYEKAGGHAIYFNPENIYFALRKKENAVKGRHMEMASPGTSPGAQEKAAPPAVVRLTPLGMQPGVKIEAVEPQEARFNYFFGNDPAKWRTNIPSYRAVVYREAYPGIDLKFYGTGRQLEYDIVVKPGADPNRVKFQYAGIKNLEVTRTGDLAIKLPDGGQLIQKKPIVYQEIAGQRLAREGKFRIHQNTAQYIYGFEVAAYDNQYPLVIDPVLVYSTYLGGSNTDDPNGIAVDAGGDAYVTGSTNSDIPLPPFPPPVPLGTTEGPFQPYRAGGYDAFVVKLNATGSALIYGTYLGGLEDDGGYGIAVDEAGYAYVVGSTNSTDFPTTENAWQSQNAGGGDVFVTKITPNGSDLVYSTYLGGGDSDSSAGIGVDAADNAYITGYTSSDNFPTTENAFQPYRAGGYDAFVVKLNATGSALIYGTYLGGNNIDVSGDIAVDDAGCAYVVGFTHSTDFPTTENAWQSENAGGSDAFVCKIDPAKQPSLTLVYSTYLGGTLTDNGSDIAVDEAGHAYVAGLTYSTDFPITENAWQSDTAGAGDAFVSKIDPTAGEPALTLVYSTYLGGTLADSGSDIAVDKAGYAYVVGSTNSTDFPTKYAFQSARAGLTDAFITKITPSGSALIYSTYLGGSDDDSSRGIAVDEAGHAYVAGRTYSTDFPTEGALQPANAGDCDVFVAKMGLAPQEQVKDITNNVQALVAAGVLNKGQGNSLTRKLADALDQLDKENTHAAIQKLQEFISVVEGYIRTGKLSDEEGQSLIGAAENVISQFG